MIRYLLVWGSLLLWGFADASQPINDMTGTKDKSFSAAALWTFVPSPNYPPNQLVSPYGTITVQYTVTNQSSTTRVLQMKPIPGVTASGCSVILGNQTCLLTLTIQGNALTGNVVGGPVLCNQGSPLQCYQPSRVNELKITLTDQTFTIGGSVSGLTQNGLILRNNGTNNLAVASGASSFQFSNPVPYGGNYEVTIFQQPSGLVCSVSDGSGTQVMSDVTTVVISCRSLMAYVANYGADNISAYSIDSQGGLTEISGSPFTAGTNPFGIAISPNGQFLYATNNGFGDISAYTIDSTGALHSIIGSPFTSGTYPQTIAISPNGNFAYVVNAGSSTVAGFYINSVTGVLTEMADSPFMTSIQPNSIAITPNGRFAYVTTVLGYVDEYVIDSTTGELTMIGTLSNSGTNYGIAITPNGEFAYIVQHDNNGQVYSYTIDPATGTLSQNGTAISAGQDPFLIAISPDGAFAYVTNSNNQGISAYRIDSMGTLTSLQMTGNSSYYGVAITPDGRFAYATNNSGNIIDGYSITALTGMLAALINGFPITTVDAPLTIAIG